jgi:cold shock CspA family protein
MADTNVADTSSSRYTGRVKWFNNKAGYGFITITDGAKSGTDVFVHHTSISVTDEQYKYLVQGEYVDFGLTPMSEGKHEFQASSVSGVKGGKLMCETRRDIRVSRAQHKSSQEEAKVETEVAKPKSKPAPKKTPVPKKESAPKRATASKKSEDGEWTTIVKKGPPKKTTASKKDN